MNNNQEEVFLASGEWKDPLQESSLIECFSEHLVNQRRKKVKDGK